MKKEKIEELLVSVSQKCGHCKHWRYRHHDQGDCECYQIPNTHKDDGSLCERFRIDEYSVQIGINEFTQAINQAELKWDKKLKKKIGGILVNLYSPTVHQDLEKYFIEIKEKIKELENDR